MWVRVLDSLKDISPATWNALAGDNPFVRHEFLFALERGRCVGEDTGWLPQYLVAHSAEGDERLLGAVPLYLKYHSYGEYVFDWAWANAYARSGESYYPKLVVAVPFTPATGPRLLLGNNRRDVGDALVERALALARERKCSSLHWLFTTTADTEHLAGHGFMRRLGYQFHWANPGYGHFDEFLASLSADKRNKIKRERRHIEEAEIKVETLVGGAITAAHWDVFYDFYCATIRAYGAMPYLTREFFHLVGQSMKDHVVLVVAHQDRRYVGAALNMRGNDTLYGRYWGGDPSFKHLHFVTCYYSGIEFCIATGLKYFEAGAQGAHKLARGFQPTMTYSAHWLENPRFRHAVNDFLQREHRGVERMIAELKEHSPFKIEPASRPLPKERSV